MTPKNRTELKNILDAPSPHDVAFKLSQHMSEDAADAIAQYVYEPLRREFIGYLKGNIIKYNSRSEHKGKRHRALPTGRTGG
jgi:hypothetical protein